MSNQTYKIKKISESMNKDIKYPTSSNQTFAYNLYNPATAVIVRNNEKYGKPAADKLHEGARSVLSSWNDKNPSTSHPYQKEIERKLKYSNYYDKK